jgi:hypothetical protein
MVPTFIMFVLSTWFVQTSVDYWFQAQVETSMDQALAVGQDFYAAAESGLESRPRGFWSICGRGGLDFKAKGAEEALRQKSREYRLTLSGVLTGTMQQRSWQASPVWDEVWPADQGPDPVQRSGPGFKILGYPLAASGFRPGDRRHARGRGRVGVSCGRRGSGAGISGPPGADRHGRGRIQAAQKPQVSP